MTDDEWASEKLRWLLQRCMRGAQDELLAEVLRLSAAMNRLRRAAR